MRSFRDVEAAATAQKAMQVYRAFEADLRQLAMTNRDYAQWDDSAQFVQDRNQHYVDANLVRETLSGIHVDLVWIVDRDGKEIYSGVADHGIGPMVTPAPSTYLQELARFLPKDSGIGSVPVNAVVATRHGLVAVAAQEIRRSDRSQATGATLLFARFIGDGDIQRVSETSQLPVTMSVLTGTAAQTRLPRAVRNWLAASDVSRPTFAAADDERLITGYAVVRDRRRASDRPVQHPLAPRHLRPRPPHDPG